MTSRPILYSFRRCPYAMRARLALLVSGIVCEIREVKLSAKPAEMLALSPKGTVPVLRLPGGMVIDESIDIMRWALARNDPQGWLGRGDAALIAANDGPFKHHLDRYKYPERYISGAPMRHQRAAISHQQAGFQHLAVLEARLASSMNLCGDTRGLADAAIFPFVRQFAAADPAWFAAQPLPHLQGWLARNIASPLFAAAMIRLAPWQAGDAAILFPALPFTPNNP